MKVLIIAIIILVFIIPFGITLYALMKAASMASSEEEEWDDTSDRH